MATGNSQPGAYRRGIDFKVHAQIPWNAPEAFVMLDSPGVFELDTTVIPDVLGFRALVHDAAPVRGMRGRTDGSDRVLIPNAKEFDRGFHDVTLLDMADAVKPVVPVGDLGLLRRQWPVAVLSSMLRQQLDYEKMRHKCKRRFRGIQTGCCSYCGVVIKMDMAPRLGSVMAIPGVVVYQLEGYSTGLHRSPATEAFGT